MPNEILEPGVIYHFYNRGNNQENIFVEERNYNYFLLLMKKYIVPIADVYAYCLLKNHFHIALKIKDNDDLPEKYREKIHLPFSNMFNTYSKSFNKAYLRKGSLFQEHPKRNRVESEEYLRQLVVYIHLNPSKHKFTNQFENYHHSSFKAYQTEKMSNIDTEFIFELFGGKENFLFYHDERKINYEGLINEIDLFDE